MSISFEPKNTRFSLKNAYALALCSKLAYESEKVIQDKLAQHGFSSIFIERKETQAFIAYNDFALVLSFRGTSHIQDWMTNSDLLLSSIRSGVGKVHTGFLHALYVVWDDILRIIADVQNNAQPFWITGHSLGAALATLAAACFTLEMDKPISGVYTFGQPRVGDRDFARLFNAELGQRFFRFVNNSDIVTRIPTRELFYSHVGSLRFFDSKGDLHDDVSFWQAFLEGVRGTLKDQIDLIPSNAEYHTIQNYIQNIQAKL